MKFRTLIVDDEKPARNKIRHFLESDPEMEIIGESENGSSALKSIQEDNPDLIFLDIQMPLMDGLALLRRTSRERSFAVIFVTAYDEYAVRAFEVNAMDYLLKPFTKRRFDEAIRKVKQQFLQKQRLAPADQAMALLEKLHLRHQYIERIPVKSERGITFLGCDQIEWIETSDNYILIHVRNEKHLVRESMSHIQQSLNPSKFLRIHRRILVNTDFIREMHPHYRSCLILHNGSTLPVSRRMKERVKRFLLNKPEKI